VGGERLQLTLGPRERDTNVAVMQVIRGGCGHQQAVARVGQCMALAADDALGEIGSAHALEPDTARAHGLRIKDGPRRTGPTPTRSRSAKIKACASRSNTPPSAQRWNQRYTVPPAGSRATAGARRSWYAGHRGCHRARRTATTATCGLFGVGRAAVARARPNRRRLGRLHTAGFRAQAPQAAGVDIGSLG
jgi:hypothetical protein